MARYVSRESLPLFFPHLLQITLFFFFFFILSLQEIISTTLSPVMEARAHIQSSVTLTEHAVWEWEFTAFCSGRQSNPPKSQTLPPSLPLPLRKPLGELWALVQSCSPVTLGRAPPFSRGSKYLFQEASQCNQQDPGWDQGLASFCAALIFVLCLSGAVPGGWSSPGDAELC